MSAKLGRVTTLQVDDGGGYDAVGKLVDGTYNGNMDEVETSSHDSAGNREYLPGFTDATIDATLRYDEADAGQIALWASLSGKTTFAVKWNSEEGIGFEEWTCATAFVTSMSHAGPNEDAQELSVTIRLSGAITKATQV